MKKPTFFEGVSIALLSGISAMILFAVLSLFLLSGELIRITVALFSFLYILYLFSRSNQRLGRMTVLFVWFVATATALFFSDSLLIHFAIQLIMVSLVRSLYFYDSLFSALTDMVLSVTSVIISIFVWDKTGNLLLTFWCLFLVQALFVYIPKNFFQNKNQNSEKELPDEKFENAYRIANSAVAKLLNRTG